MPQFASAICRLCKIQIGCSPYPEDISSRFGHRNSNESNRKSGQIDRRKMWIRIKLSVRLDMCKLQFCQTQHLLSQVCPTTSAGLSGGKNELEKCPCHELTGGPTFISLSVRSGQMPREMNLNMTSSPRKKKNTALSAVVSFQLHFLKLLHF